jgi:copper resistance protein C
VHRLTALLAALSLSLAGAHTAVTSVTPALNATVSAPASVTLTFNEAVETRFSTFRVMAVPTGRTAQAAATLALAEKPGSARLVNRAATLPALAARVTLPLRADLKPGAYVIAWKILSEDGHPVSGHSSFRVR